MTGSGHLDSARLYELLLHARRHGARAPFLVRYTPEVIDLLRPAAADNVNETMEDRSFYAENVIRRAIDAIGGEAGQALSVVLALSAGTLGRTLEDRRHIAGQRLRIAGDTFRRSRYEDDLLHVLAQEIRRLHTQCGHRLM